MKLKIIVIFIMFLFLVPTSCSIPETAGPNSIIDWVDFIVLNDIHYRGNYHGDNKLSRDSIEGIVGEVKFNVSENINDHNYKVKNGDSAFLPKGTNLYKMKGYKPEFRIAVNTEGGWRIYEADSNSRAEKGEDLLDIRDKVLYISINSETDGKTELGVIKDKVSIDKLVNMTLNAEVNQSNQEHDGQRYFISFHLLDGSDVTRCYWIDSGELSRGIMLPDEVGMEIRKVLTSEE